MRAKNRVRIRPSVILTSAAMSFWLFLFVGLYPSNLSPVYRVVAATATSDAGQKSCPYPAICHLGISGDNRFGSFCLLGFVLQTLHHYIGLSPPPLRRMRARNHGRIRQSVVLVSVAITLLGLFVCWVLSSKLETSVSDYRGRRNNDQGRAPLANHVRIRQFIVLPSR